jgi:hypothetical protein
MVWFECHLFRWRDVFFLGQSLLSSCDAILGLKKLKNETGWNEIKTNETDKKKKFFLRLLDFVQDSSKIVKLLNVFHL